MVAFIIGVVSVFLTSIAISIIYGCIFYGILLMKSLSKHKVLKKTNYHTYFVSIIIWGGIYIGFIYLAFVLNSSQAYYIGMTLGMINFILNVRKSRYLAVEDFYDLNHHLFKKNLKSKSNKSWKLNYLYLLSLEK